MPCYKTLEVLCLRHAVSNAYKYKVTFSHTFPTLHCNSLFNSMKDQALSIYLQYKPNYKAKKHAILFYNYIFLGFT